MATALLEMRPCSIVEILRRAVKIYMATFWGAIPFSFVLALLSTRGFTKRYAGTSKTVEKVSVEPGSVVVEQTANGPVGDSFVPATEAGNDFSTNDSLLIGAVLFFGSLLALILYFTFYMGLIKQIDSTAKGKQITFKEVLSCGFKKVLPAIGVFVLTVIAVAIGFMLLIIPGIYLSIALFFSLYLIVTDNLGVMDSLKESMQLVSKHWWRTFFLLIITGLIISLLYALSVGGVFILDSIFASGSRISTEITGAVTMTALTKINPFVLNSVIVILNTLLLPLVYSATLSILYDLQSRKEVKT